MKIVIGIATMQGRKKYLEKTLESLVNQGAEIHVYHNNKETIDYTDNGKFYPLHKFKDEPIYFLSCDDDIIYPTTYVQDMVEAIDLFGRIVTHHGRILLGENRSYYHGHKAFRCSSEIKENVFLDVAGTGVTGFRTDYFNPINLHESRFQRMSDLVFSLAAAINGKEIVLLTHAKDYFITQDVPEIETIYGQEHNKCSVQNLLADEIYKRKKPLQ